MYLVTTLSESSKAAGEAFAQGARFVTRQRAPTGEKCGPRGWFVAAGCEMCRTRFVEKIRQGFFNQPMRI